MKFKTLGSCVNGDIVNKAKGKGWSLETNYVSYSPYAMILGKDINFDLVVNKDIFSDETDDHIRKVNNFLTGDVFKKFMAVKADYILVDLSDFRIQTNVLNFENGKKFYLTNGILNDKNILKLGELLANKMNTKFIPKINAIKLQDLSDEELKNYIDQFLQNIYENFDKNNVIFIKPKLVCQYINGNEISYTQNCQISGTTNDVIDRIYKLASEFVEFVEPPKNLIGDVSCMTPFEYHYCQPYYDYMIKTISYILDGNKIDEAVERVKQNCEEEIDKKINKIFCENILNKMNLHINKKIVLIAKNKYFDELLKIKYNINISNFIEYNKNSDLVEIEKNINNLKSEDVIFVVPEIFNHGEQQTLFSVFYREFLILDIDYFMFVPKKVFFDKFIGKFIDCYNNEISIGQGVPIKFFLNGVANKVVIKKQRRIFTFDLKSGDNIIIDENCMLSGIIYMGWDSNINIGKKTTIAANADIAVHSFSTLSIGEDCMFSFNEIIYTGDGHPIFIKDKNRYIQINNCFNDEIIVGNHVWIGHSCKMLSGTKIGDGSIVGAGSLTNKSFPNNVIIVGNPAKIIKKNVAWIRNILIRELEKDVDVFNNYANETKDV